MKKNGNNPIQSSSLKRDSRAWQEGFDAGKANKHSKYCKYPPFSQEAWNWISGWIDGKEELNLKK